jgi:F-type H+-transporting ATPase subunit b
LKHINRPCQALPRIFFHFLLAVLVIGAAGRPHRALAQQPAPAPAHGNGADKIIARSGAQETAAEDENIYRHTPLVQSMARSLHLDVETTARLFEYINFAIIALAIVVPLAKLLPKILRQRSQKLRQDLDAARKMTADAGLRLSAIESKLAGLDREIAAIRAQVEDEVRNDETRIRAAIKEESGRIVAAAEQEIGLAATQAARQLVLTQETDRALISEFVVEAGRNGAHAEGRS